MSASDNPLDALVYPDDVEYTYAVEPYKREAKKKSKGRCLKVVTFSAIINFIFLALWVAGIFQSVFSFNLIFANDANIQILQGQVADLQKQVNLQATMLNAHEFNFLQSYNSE
jgi:hypothetical protein